MHVSTIPLVMRTFSVQVRDYGKVVIPKTIRSMVPINKDDHVTVQLLEAIKPDGEPRNVKKLPANVRTFTGKVLHNYRLTIPSNLRRTLGIRQDDTLTLVLLEHMPAYRLKED